jgi:hypothetical protein
VAVSTPAPIVALVIVSVSNRLIANGDRAPETFRQQDSGPRGRRRHEKCRYDVDECYAERDARRRGADPREDQIGNALRQPRFHHRGRQNEGADDQIDRRRREPVQCTPNVGDSRQDGRRNHEQARDSKRYCFGEIKDENSAEQRQRLMALKGQRLRCWGKPDRGRGDNCQRHANRFQQYFERARNILAVLHIRMRRHVSSSLGWPC